LGYAPDRLAAAHARLAKALGIGKQVEACERDLGVEYENAIKELLTVENSWSVRTLDDGKRQNVPDLLVEANGIGVLIECKTTDKAPPLIKKEEAWAVLQKAADFDRSFHRVTLGKKGFDETSKKKAAACHDLSLVEHSVFVEAVLRVHAGTLSVADFLTWLSTPGVAELDRLGGKPTFVG
jgi:helicase